MARALEIPQFKSVRPLHRPSQSERSKPQWCQIRALTSPIWLPEISAQLNQLADLPSNWDSYSSPPVSSVAILKARTIIVQLDIGDLPKPHVCAVAGGGVGLHWRVGTRDLELDIDADAKIAFVQTILPDQMTDGTVERIEDLQSVIDWAARQ